MNILKTHNLLNAALSAYVTLAGSGRCFHCRTENNGVFILLEGRKSLPKSNIQLQRYSGNGNDICVEGDI